MSAPRVALIGARRAHQGLGPFVARELRAAGAELPCLLGTSDESVESAERELQQSCGLRLRGYVELDELLAREKLDALAILCPFESHERYLEAALAAGLHALCEKPLLWGGTAPGARAERLAEGFSARGLHLFENCQWPFALPAFDALHPQARRGRLRRFGMHLSPATPGNRILADCMSHPLSLLQALAPGEGARVAEPRYQLRESQRGEESEPRGLRVEFAYVAGQARVEAEVELSTSDETPRRAGFAINGQHAERLVRPSDYALVLASGTRWVALPDPLQGLLRSFVSTLAAGDPPSAERTRNIAERAQMLEELERAFERGNS